MIGWYKVGDMKSSTNESRMTDVITLLTKLVSFDTTSSESNLALIEYVEGYLAEYGVSAERVMSPCGTKANLIAELAQRRRAG
ncbi:hypothetical protein HORIV_03490 [Vreelandella olivaria]|uniref:Acetylornithine deacetylase n=1 Tax=Vreelandella olivaria TaxID=390919 RepID=A0ABM7GC02_9GAMM|nr:hypothetical protein HORIV_03490 [Halomonas olivaria]